METNVTKSQINIFWLIEDYYVPTSSKVTIIGFVRNCTEDVKTNNNWSREYRLFWQLKNIHIIFWWYTFSITTTWNFHVTAKCSLSSCHPSSQFKENCYVDWREAIVAEWEISRTTHAFRGICTSWSPYSCHRCSSLSFLFPQNVHFHERERSRVIIRKFKAAHFSIPGPIYTMMLNSFIRMHPSFCSSPISKTRIFINFFCTGGYRRPPCWILDLSGKAHRGLKELKSNSGNPRMIFSIGHFF